MIFHDDILAIMAKMLNVRVRSSSRREKVRRVVHPNDHSTHQIANGTLFPGFLPSMSVILQSVVSQHDYLLSN